jgi:hypothetical protein
MRPLTVFGVTALTFMLVTYSLERRNAGFTLAFAAGCAMSSAYGFASGAEGIPTPDPLHAIGLQHD